MLFETKNLRIFIYQDQIDMRCGFEKLCHYVKDKMQNNINCGHVYLFFGKNRRRIKAIYYDGTGLVLVAKRIEHGRFVAIAEIANIKELSVLELKQIFHGGVIVKPKLERSLMTQLGQDLLPKGNEQSFTHASS